MPQFPPLVTVRGRRLQKAHAEPNSGCRKRACHSAVVHTHAKGAETTSDGRRTLYVSTIVSCVHDECCKVLGDVAVIQKPEGCRRRLSGGGSERSRQVP